MKARINKIYKYFVRLFCDHEYSSDTQIRVIKCNKCEDKRWYDYKNLYDK